LKLSLVLPAYNEEKTIEEVINRVDSIVKQTGLKYELIVVDDGSWDFTRKKASNCANNNSHIKIVSYRRNMGKGHAIKTGFAHAKGDAVVFMDSDLDIDPRQITRYVEALNYGDMVIASKWHPQSNVEIPLIRRFLSRAFNVLVKLLMGIKVRDTQTGLKAVRRKALDKVFLGLNIERYAFDVELLAVANLHGLKIVELPVNIRMRGLFDFTEVWKMFVDLLTIAYRLRVLKQYQCLSVSKMNRIGLKNKV
jgi:glycosyltransferase involved in cell wall biosynthesis